MQVKDAPGVRIPGKTESDLQIGLGDVAMGFVRPFDQTDGIVPKVFAQTGILKLTWVVESIKIKVVEV